MSGRGRRSLVVPVVVALVALLSAAGCGTSSGETITTDALGDDDITVGSFDFAESVMLAEIYSQALERAGLSVERAFALGPREFVAPALAVGLVEVVPEYAGSAATFLNRGVAVPPADGRATHRALRDRLAGRPVTALAPAPAQNANAFVVTAATAARLRLRDVSDLAPVAGDLIFGGPPECQRRALCLVGLEREYGIEFDTVVSLRAGSLIEQALRDGGIDVGLLFTSDAAMATGDFVELRDDRGLQPAENVTPLVRDEVLARWGEAVVTGLDGVSAALTTSELRALNADLAGDTGAAAAVAAGWLDEQGL